MSFIFLKVSIRSPSNFSALSIQAFIYFKHWEVKNHFTSALLWCCCITVVPGRGESKPWPQTWVWKVYSQRFAWSFMAGHEWKSCQRSQYLQALALPPMLPTLQYPFLWRQVLLSWNRTLNSRFEGFIGVCWQRCMSEISALSHCLHLIIHISNYFGITLVYSRSLDCLLPLLQPCFIFVSFSQIVSCREE